MPRKARELDRGTFPLALLNGEVLKVLKKHRVPAHWCDPESVNVLRGMAEGGIPRHPLADPPLSGRAMELEKAFVNQIGPQEAKKLRETREAIRDLRARESELAVRMSGEDPKKFWKVMVAISSRVEAKYRSPEFHAAMTIALHWNTIKRLEYADDQAAYLESILGVPITLKTFVHAKRRALDAGLLKLPS
jgi:hypothetical protein